MFSLHSKRFRGVGEQRKTKEQSRNTAFSPCEVGVRAKTRKKGWGRGRKEMLVENPWILKTSIRQQTELVSGWTSQTLLTCVDHRIKKGN